MCDELDGHVQPNLSEGNWMLGWRIITESVRNWWRGDPLQDLRTAEYVLDVAVESGQFADESGSLRRARNNLRGFNSAVTRIDNWRERLTQLSQIHDAVQTLNSNRDYSDEEQREAAAAAFGQLFASLGSIAAQSNIPTLSMYGELFSNSGEFFTNMLRGLTHGARRADRAFEEAAPYENRRGWRGTP